MAVEVLAAGGDGSCTIELGPGLGKRRVRPGERVVWQWPIDGAGGENVQPLPSKWRVLRTLDGDELERRLEGLKPEARDPQRDRATSESKPAIENRGYNDKDKARIAQAVESLNDKTEDHWTRQGKPDIQAIRERFEKIEMKVTGAREWPSWLTREIVDMVGTRKRGDVEKSND